MSLFCSIILCGVLSVNNPLVSMKKYAWGLTFLTEIMSESLFASKLGCN